MGCERVQTGCGIFFWRASGLEDSLLGGSWVVIHGLVSPQIRVIRKITLLITPLITTHEPPSTV